MILYKIKHLKVLFEVFIRRYVCGFKNQKPSQSSFTSPLSGFSLELTKRQWANQKRGSEPLLGNRTTGYKSVLFYYAMDRNTFEDSVNIFKTV